ncbi:hypothetical protein VaNZ11_008035 [Volvox africanus]|uniref:Uncharacterized protein n=1 Tax=Volvox africanus TaxID=51714 RepID=A0ABQ5S4A0_9CHLO|nr:hypothetical protein VaNZ11_008035 [Volvox africanus]
MGVDYVARKSAKKRKKRERQAVGKDGVAQRERRRKKIRRLCQGVCYKTPELTEEDKRWSDQENGDNVGALDSDVEEAVARVNSHQGASTTAAAATARGSRLQKQSAAADGKKTKEKQKRKRADVGEDDDNGGGGGRTKLSTSVQLLAPSVLAQNARQAALRKLPVGAKTDALEQFPPLLQACMLSLHHLEPTPVQERCWPSALEGRDIQGVAEPGSGKTLAYLLPGLVKLQTDGHSAASHPEGPAMLVLLPTRELAQQVAGQCRAIRPVTGLRTLCVFGGAPREEQAALLLTKQPHVLVATPGRLLDLVDGGELKLQDTVRYLVLDEADKMLSLGFKPQLDRLYDMHLKSHDEAATTATAAPATRNKKAAKAKIAQEPAPLPGAMAAGDGPRPQVLLFSATMPETVIVAAAQWLRRPEIVSVNSSGANAISRTVTQVVHVCADHKKPEKLLKHLHRVRESIPPGCRNPHRVLVFANRVKTVRFLTTTLSREGYKVAQLHGQRSQVERNQAVANFRSGKVQVLVATDVAARGLDIRALPYVVNYDFPSRLETYVHRVGRTGRLSAYGHAYSFFSRNLAPLAPPLLDLLRAHDQAVDPNLMALAAAWKVAEEKLGGKGVASAAAAIARGVTAKTGDADGEGEDDDEGDDHAAAAGERLSIAEEVLTVADDLLEGLGPRDVRAIAALLNKKVLRRQQQESPGENADTSNAAAAAPADDDDDNYKDLHVSIVPPHKKSRGGEVREQKEQAAAPPEEVPGRQGVTDGGGGSAGRLADTYLVPMSKEQREAMQKQQQKQPGGTAAVRQAVFVPAKAFKGAMAGYAFKKGAMGVGYYLDQQQAVVAAEGKRSKVAVTLDKQPVVAALAAATAAVPVAVVKRMAGGEKKAAAADAFVKKKALVAAAAWGLPTRNKPLIPVRHSDFLTDSDDDSIDDDSGRDGGRDLDSDSERREPSPVARVGGRSKRNVVVVAARNSVLSDVAKGRGKGTTHRNGFGDGDLSDVKDIADNGGQRAIAKGRHKALPGRLRQKLKGQK